MTDTAEVSFVFGGEERTFKLGWKQILELEDRTGLGTQALLEAIGNGTHKDSHLFHALRLGLIGAGVEPDAAHRIMTRAVETSGTRYLIQPAFQVLHATWDWTSDPFLKKKAQEEAAAKSASSSPMDAGTAQH